MIFKEVTQDLFTVSDDYYLAHCISADFALGAGIAVEFNKRFNMREILKLKYPNFLYDYISYHWNGVALIEDRIINLVTKEQYWHKPTYESLREALNLAYIRISSNCHKIAMPQIGCGLDGLKWDKVSQIIKDVFNDSDIEILVCKNN